MFEIWWLLFLLPLAAASGWWLARREVRHGGRNAAYDLPSAYFKGLNYLLNEQPDKAIEVFVKVLEVDSETVETHLAVGNLFRRRGEVERATRIHQNLIARPNLDKVQRSQALFELAQDYLKAGLFDRAENLLQELAELREHGGAALRGLVQIYEQEKEWENAIAATRKLVRIAGARLDPVIAHYTCELAEQAHRSGAREQAREYARRALSADRNCVRATMLLGQLYAETGEHANAIRAWKKIGEQDADFLGEVVGPISNSYRALGDEQGLYRFLRDALKRHGGVALMLALTDVVEVREGARDAERFVLAGLREHATIHGLYRLIELNLVHASEAGRPDLEVLRMLIGHLVEQQEGYLCRQCGFTGKQVHWQCPGCKNWNTVKPRLPEEAIDPDRLS